MKILLSDPRVDAVVLRDSGEPLVALPAFFGPARARVRAGLVDRLARAQTLLPRGVRLRVVEGHRSVPASGFVNYPTEWWHWSYGDRYWALITSAPAAFHGPLAARPDAVGAA